MRVDNLTNPMPYIPDEPLTVEQFVKIRAELPEAGQWAELNAGRVRLFDAPDTDHGLVVSHLTKKLAPLAMIGTPVFRPSLIVDGNGDSSTAGSVQIPAVAYFDIPAQFELIDAITIDRAPAWIIELASTGDRRKAMSERVSRYVSWGVELLWIIDPRDRTLTTICDGKQRQHGETALVSPEPIVDIAFPLSELFVEPEWWTGNKR